MKNKTTPLELSKELRHLSRQMRKLGIKMEYYGGFGETGKHGRELIGASIVVRGWTRVIKISET